MLEHSEPAVYQLRVVLLGISPLIWRRLLVPGRTSLADLHDILQIAFGWTDDSLHQFLIHGRKFGLSREGGLSFRDNPHDVRLADFAFRPGENFLYEYDFLSNWQHLIRVEAIRPSADHYPICSGGKRIAPPEDCGGLEAFLQLQQSHPQESHILRLAELLQQSDICNHIDELAEIHRRLRPDRFDRRAVNQRLMERSIDARNFRTETDRREK
jgi:hypothetical protein